MKSSQTSLPHFKTEQRRQQKALQERLFRDITFDAKYNLETFHGFHVGSYVQFNPELMQLFIKNRSTFSNSFLEKYSAGIFEVSYFQGHILFDVEYEKIGLYMPDNRHREEFMSFIANNGKHRMRSHSEHHLYVSIDYRNLVNHFPFENVLIPTSL